MHNTRLPRDDFRRREMIMISGGVEVVAFTHNGGETAIEIEIHF
jgi:hypothetical protein